MANAPHDHVHRLIRSMSPAEKRYFKLHTSRHMVAGHSNHQALFDTIASMVVYDERKLRGTYADAPFMRRFAITKRRLYEAVLASLDAFHAERSVDDKLHRMLHHVEILHQRALYADAGKVLQGARQLARANDKQALLLQVAEWERRLMERGNYVGTTEKDLEQRARSIAGITGAWEEVDRLWQLKSRIFLILYRSGQGAGKDVPAVIEAVAADPLLKQGVRLLSPRARFLHHHVRSAVAYARQDLAACEVQLAQCAEILRAEHGCFKEEPDLLLGVMGNLANVRMRSGKGQEAVDGFRQFRRIPLLLANAPSPDLEVKLFVMGTSLELSFLTVKGEFTQALGTLGGLEDGLAKYGTRTSAVRRAELALQAAYACFGGGAHDMALRWCHRLLNEQGIEEHIELHALGRMLNAAVLIELGKEELLGYVLRNTQRFLKQHGHAFAMESLLLDQVSALARTNGSKATRALWASFAERLAECAKDAREATVLDHMDLVSWAQGKAQGKDLSELVKLRYQARAGAGKPAKRGADGRQAA